MSQTELFSGYARFRIFVITSHVEQKAPALLWSLSVPKTTKVREICIKCSKNYVLGKHTGDTFVRNHCFRPLEEVCRHEPITLWRSLFAQFSVILRACLNYYVRSVCSSRARPMPRTRKQGVACSLLSLFAQADIQFVGKRTGGRHRRPQMGCFLKDINLHAVLDGS